MTATPAQSSRSALASAIAADGGIVERGQQIVIEAMTRNLVAAGGDRSDQARMAPGDPAKDEEGALDPLVRTQIEQALDRVLDPALALLP